MKISVLIAAYRAAGTLPRTLESIRHQSHRDWELIVVEDGSRDETQQIVAQFAATCRQPVRYHNLGTNQGVSAARNQLLQLAAGDAVAFVDADDLWEPNHLEAGAIRLQQDADFVVSGVRTFDLVTGRDLGEFPAPISLVRDPVAALFERSVIITSSAVFIRRDLALRVGEFDRTLRVGEDRDFWLRCALTGARFSTVPMLTCRYAKHAGSTMARTLLVAEQSVLFYEKHRNLAVVPVPLRRRLLADSLISLGRVTRAQDARRSAASFWKAWRCAPMNPSIPCHLALSGWRSAFAKAH